MSRLYIHCAFCFRFLGVNRVEFPEVSDAGDDKWSSRPDHEVYVRNKSSRKTLLLRLQLQLDDNKDRVAEGFKPQEEMVTQIDRRFHHSTTIPEYIGQQRIWKLDNSSDPYNSKKFSCLCDTVLIWNTSVKKISSARHHPVEIGQGNTRKNTVIRC